MMKLSCFRNGETASCTIVFILVYYFMMAGCVWFVMLAFAWYLTFRALGTQRDDLKNKTSYFHIASWCVPLVLTIVCLSVSEVGFFYDIAKMYTILYALSLNLFLRGKTCISFLFMVYVSICS